MNIIFLYIAIISLSSLVLQTTAQESCAKVNDEEITSVTDLENADFIFAGLFPIRESGCERYNIEKGVERMEAMIRAIDLINNDTSILKGLKIGYDMRDTCGQETIGIEETVSLVQSEFATGNLTGIPIGVIGAASSSVSVPVASFLRVFTIPQISYASTSALLSDTDRYDYFFRTVAPDSFQARAMLDLIRKFNWRYVNAVYTASTYGTPGVEAFQRAVDETNDTCLDVESQVPENEDMLRELAEQIARSDANVVVCFCTSTDANRILTAVNAYITSNVDTANNRTHIVWIASDAWATSEAAINGSERFVDGFYGISPLSQEFTNFTEYFTNISPYNLTNDKWFCGYFRQKFNCQYNVTNGDPCPDSINAANQSFVQNNIVPFIFDATYALAYALDSVLRENCYMPYNITLQECENKAQNGTVKVGGQILRDAMYNVNFTGITGNTVAFDASGDGPAKYTIYNYKYAETEGNFNNVGDWDISRGERLILRNNTNPVDNITSFCGGIAPCEVGFRTNFQVGSGQCCWTCEPCLGNTFNPVMFTETCRVCPSGEWGNDPTNINTECVPIQISFINYNEWWCWVFLVFNLVSFVGWVIISIIYLYNWNHRVVRASGREHCLLMLAGAGIGFALAFFTLAKPIIFTCIVWPLIYWLSLSLLIFPLLMKIIRIVRIFISKQNVHTRRFISWQWQIVFSLIPVAIVMSIVVIAFSTKPEVIEEFSQVLSELEPPKIQLRCQRAHSAFIICLYAIFILAVIILLFSAILTRTYPKNFRESVHIMYASFALIVVMFVNVIIFFILSGEFQIYGRIVQNLCLILVSYTILLAFFGPRLYYVLFGPKVTPEDPMSSMATADRTELSTIDLKKRLGSKHPSILNPFDKYMSQQKDNSAGTITECDEEKLAKEDEGTDNIEDPSKPINTGADKDQ